MDLGLFDLGLGQAPGFGSLGFGVRVWFERVWGSETWYICEP